MTESEWLECADPELMLDYLCETYPRLRTGIRKIRLYACAAFRATGGGSWNADSVWGLATAEGHADGGVSDEELLEAHASFPRDLVAEYLLRSDASDAAYSLTRHRFPGGSADATGEADSLEVADILRDIVGNPFRKVRVRGFPDFECKVCSATPDREGEVRHGKGCYMLEEDGGGSEYLDLWEEPWLTPLVLSLAHAAYDERQPDGTLDHLRLAVLADALEEAGCDSEYILAHLRSPGSHWRGCWVVDLILGKE